MDLYGLYGGSFVNWEVVGGSWTKRTVSSRLLLFAARRYLEQAEDTLYNEERSGIIETTPLPDEVKRAFSLPPDDPFRRPLSGLWGEFLDAALASEIEMVSYGERPLLLHELRAGLERAAEEAEAEDGSVSELRRWFLGRRDALPGDDLPEDLDYLPV